MRRISIFLALTIVVGPSAVGSLAFAGLGVASDTTVVLDYIAAINGGDVASVRRLHDRDASVEFAQAMPVNDLVQFFRNYKRATGGVDFVDARVRAGAPDTIDVVVRDHIYGALHGVVLTLDGRADGRVSDFEPAESTPAWALAPGKALSPAVIAARARDLIDRGCRAGVFSGAALVAKGDAVLVHKACGSANRRYDARNTVETRFNLGSMNKMFTAVAVRQLVEAGKVSLSDPLSRFADESWLPRDISSQITIEQLLTHTSGLGSFDEGDAFSTSARNLYSRLDDYKPVMRKETLAFAPGTKYQYSDTGMFMLGVVVEKASGESYFDYVREHIYRPAGMSATDCYPMNEPVKNLAMGYYYAPDSSYGWHENTFAHLFRGGPAGGGFSTVGDMFRFARALRAGKLVSAASLKALWTDRAPNDYGEGFEVMQTAAGKVVGHSGMFSGISSRMSLYLDKGYVVVALSNIDNGAPSLMEAIADQIAYAP